MLPQQYGHFEAYTHRICLRLQVCFTARELTAKLTARELKNVLNSTSMYEVPYTRGYTVTPSPNHSNSPKKHKILQKTLTCSPITSF